MSGERVIIESGIRTSRKGHITTKVFVVKNNELHPLVFVDYLRESKGIYKPDFNGVRHVFDYPEEESINILFTTSILPPHAYRTGLAIASSESITCRLYLKFNRAYDTLIKVHGFKGVGMAEGRGKIINTVSNPMRERLNITETKIGIAPLRSEIFFYTGGQNE